MTRSMVSDRQASYPEVLARASKLRHAAADAGLTDVRVRADGAMIVHSGASGYHEIVQFAAKAAAIVGSYVHVISDDVPAARTAASPL